MISVTNSNSLVHNIKFVICFEFRHTNFMHQTVRGGHTDHTGSIVSLMAGIFDLKKKFLCNWTLVLL